MLLACFMGRYFTWGVIWILQAIGYFFVLQKIGLKKWTCVIPFLAERELSKVLFRRLRSFYRPFVVAVVLLFFGIYLGPGEELGGVYIIIAEIVYGIFLLRLYWRLRKSFGRGIIYFILLVLIPPLFLFLLGVGRSQYRPLPLKPLKDHGKVGNFLHKGALVLISIAEIAVLVLGVGFLAIRTLPPEVMVSYTLNDFYDKTKDLQGDGQVISREDVLGSDAGSVAEMETSRDLYFPDHSQDKNVVVLAYVVGSNLEHKGGLASANIRQMMKATEKGENLTFVMEAGGSKRWFTRGIDESSCGRYEIAGGKLEKVEALPADTCMAEGETLSDFLTWAKKNYTADRYMLVLWDHGGGVPYGYGDDDLNRKDAGEGKTTSMETSELVAAVAKAGMKFDVIGFDACLMQDIEIASALEPYTDYYLASEEVEGGYGWYYTSPFGRLAQDPGMSTQEFAADLLSCYDQLNTIVKDEDGNPDTAATLSLVDTTMARPAYQKLAGLFKDMDAAIRDDSDAFASVAVAGTNAYAFHDDMQIDLVDYLDILEKTDGENDIVSDQEYDDLIRNLKACVLYRNKNSAKGINGMAFAFPYKAIWQYGDTHAQLKELSLDVEKKTFDDIFSIMAAQHKKAMEDEDYKANIEDLSGSDESLMGILDTLAPSDYTQQSWYVKGFEDYEAARALVDIPLEQTEEGYEIQLPEKTWKIISDCQTMAYQDTGGEKGEKIYLGRDHIGGEDAEGRPLVNLEGSWIHIGGKLVCYEAEPVRETEDGDVYSGRVPARLNDKENIILHVEWDPVKEDEEAKEGHVTGYEVVHDSLLAGLLDTKGTLNLEAGDSIQFIFETYDKEGNLVKKEARGDKIRVTKQNRLKVEDLPLEDKTISFGGVLKDVYQRTMTTELVEMTME